MIFRLLLAKRLYLPSVCLTCLALVSLVLAFPFQIRKGKEPNCIVYYLASWGQFSSPALPRLTMVPNKDLVLQSKCVLISQWNILT